MNYGRWRSCNHTTVSPLLHLRWSMESAFKLTQLFSIENVIQFWFLHLLRHLHPRNLERYSWSLPLCKIDQHQHGSFSHDGCSFMVFNSTVCHFTLWTMSRLTFQPTTLMYKLYIIDTCSCLKELILWILIILKMYWCVLFVVTLVLSAAKVERWPIMFLPACTTRLIVTNCLKKSLNIKPNLSQLT